MNKLRRAGLLAAALAAGAGGAAAQPGIRFDSAAPEAGKAPASLFQAVREATKDVELPQVAVTKEAPAPTAEVAVAPAARKAALDPKAAAELARKAKGLKFDPAFWGTDGQWCRDDGNYVGGPCDNTGHWPGGRRDPWARDPSREGWGHGRSPYDDPWYRDPYDRDPYRRDPYERDPYYGDPHRDDHYRDPYSRRPRRRYPY